MREAESPSRATRPRAGSARFPTRLVLGLAAGALVLGVLGSWRWWAGRPASGSGAAVMVSANSGQWPRPLRTENAFSSGQSHEAI